MRIQDVKKLFEDNLESQIMSSELQTCNIFSLKERVDEWKNDGYTIVFTAGVFDIFTVNHLLALYHYKMLGGNRSKLIVSIDTDERVRVVKSSIKAKGNLTKPILSWKSRSLMVAKQTFRNRESLVDIIVQHGNDTCRDMRCPHDDNVTIAEEISPDIIVVTDTSADTIKKIQNSQYINNKNLLVINENELSYYDILLGGKISTSSIIKKIQNAH